MNPSFSKIWIVIILVALFAGGILVWQYFEAPEEEAINWKTYRNQDFGFEIKYPKDWRGHINAFYTNPAADVMSATFCPPNFFAEKNEGWLTYADVNAGEKGCAAKRRIWPGDDNNTVRIEGVGIVSNDVYKRDWEANINKPIFSVMIFVYKVNPKPVNLDDYHYLGDNQFGSWYLYAATKAFPQYKLIVDQVLSTFRFIEKEKAYIKVISPNGREEWIEGNTYDIIWELSEVEKVSIEIASGGKDKGHIVFGANATLGKYSWKIPNGFITGFGITESDLMKIRIYDTENQDIYDENDNYFSIIGE